MDERRFLRLFCFFSMTRFVRLYAVCFLLAASTVSASTPGQWRLLRTSRPSDVSVYQDAASQLRLNLPAGWRVRAETLNGVRQLRVVPPKADQRERAAIDVVIRVRPLAPQESLDRLARHYRRGKGDREAAGVVRFTPKTGRLVVEYREGGYVSSRLWIVRQNLNLYQRVGKKRLLEVLCAANASEYKTYHHNLETICSSVSYGK
jgi:hypothetical protein